MRKIIASFFMWVLIVQSAQASDLEEMITRFEADEAALLRKYTIESGERYKRFQEFYDNWLLELSEVDFDALSADERVDFILLKNLLERSIYFLRQDKLEFENVESVAEFASPLYELMAKRRRGTKPDALHVANILSGSIRKIDSLQGQLSSTPFSSWQQADKASLVISSLRRNLKETYNFYFGYDPEFTWWAAKSFDSLEVKLKGYEEFLKENYVNTSVKDDGSGIIGKPIGREAIIKSLQFEFIPYTPEELIKFAEEQFAWCEKQMLRASQELGFGNNWQAALEEVKNTYVAPGEQPMLIDSLAEEAIRFLEDKDLITIPELAKETWRMEMMTPERQKINPFFTGGEVISISYPTHTMDYKDKMMSMRGNNPHFSRATVHHELIPGHHMQMFMMRRYKPYRLAFSTPFWMEGWALYWEINLWEKEFAKTPENRIGMLFWRMHRCARIIFSLNYHLEKMTPQQCIDFLVDKVGHEYANAEAEVRRSFTGNYGPLYQIAYMVGGLQFYALRSELVGTGKLTEKQFHDKILREGNIPVAMIKAILNQELLKANYKSEWQFADKIKFK